MDSPLRARSIQGLMNRLQYYAATLYRMWHLKLDLVNLVCGALPDFASGAIRSRLYRMIGFEIEPGVMIAGNLKLISAEPGFYKKLRIGSDAFIGNHVTINLDAQVTLGKNVSLGPYVLIYTGTHPLGPGSNRRMRKAIFKPVRIEDGVWVGLAAIVLPGVTVGRGSVVAAGAVVTQDVPPNTFVEGNPAHVVRQLPWADR